MNKISMGVGGYRYLWKVEVHWAEVVLKERHLISYQVA